MANAIQADADCVRWARSAIVRPAIFRVLAFRVQAVPALAVRADEGHRWGHERTDRGTPQGMPGVGPVLILLLVLGLAIAIGVWLSRGQGTTSTMSQNTARMEASSLAQTASSISGAFGAAMLRDSFIPDQITFDNAARTSSGVGLFNVTDGYMAQPSQQFSALTAANLSGNTIVWQRLQANITGVGAGNNYVTVLPGVRTAVCQAINAGKWGTTPSDPVPVASNVTSANVTAGLGVTTAVAVVVLDLTTTSPANFLVNRDEGCLQSSDGVNFYFKVLSVG